MPQACTSHGCKDTRRTRRGSESDPRQTTRHDHHRNPQHSVRKLTRRMSKCTKLPGCESHKARFLSLLQSTPAPTWAHKRRFQRLSKAKPPRAALTHSSRGKYPQQSNAYTMFQRTQSPLVQPLVHSHAEARNQHASVSFLFTTTGFIPQDSLLHLNRSLRTS